MLVPTATPIHHRHRWAAVLAGGDGVRLQAYTGQLCNDRRPKQFCALISPHTLLASTRLRLAAVIAPQRTACVVTRAHEAFYRDEFSATPPQLLVEQPANRGTAVAIVFALARIARLDPNAVVGFFPSDHHYDSEPVFEHAVGSAYALASADSSRVILIGAVADRPETEYGWIARDVARFLPTLVSGHRVDGVSGFHEKPDRATALDLMERGALWNTFMMVGHVSAFIAMLSRAAPLLRSSLEWLRRAPEGVAERAEAETLYATLSPADFSRDVLTHDPSRLLVLTLPEAGWTDLGHPSRIQAVLAQAGSRQIGLVAS